MPLAGITIKAMFLDRIGPGRLDDCWSRRGLQFEKI